MKRPLKVTDNKLSLANFKIEVSTQDKGIADKIEGIIYECGFTPPSKEEVITKFGPASKMVIPLLVEQKKLVEVEKGLYFHAKILDTLKENIREYIKKQGPISVAQFRDLTKTSRKYAVPAAGIFRCNPFH